MKDIENKLRKASAKLLIKSTPTDYNAFEQLVLEHIANSTNRAPNSLACSFLNAHGKKLWPTKKEDRQHLDPWPESKNVHYWAQRSHVGADGPIFQFDAFLSNKVRKKWLSKHNGHPLPVSEEYRRSKLGLLLEQYTEKMLDKTPAILLPGSSSRELALVNGIVHGSSSTLSNKLKPVDPAAESGASTVSDVHESDELPVSRVPGNVEESSSCCPQTTPQAMAQVLEDDNAVDAIKKIRSLACPAIPIFHAELQGRKRSGAASDTSLLPSKKHKSSPRQGRFDIPQGLRRMEALPMTRLTLPMKGLTLPLKRPLSQQHAIPDIPSQIRRQSTQTPMGDDQNLRSDFPFTEIALNFIELVTAMPYPHVNEEARQKMLALYMEETGGMGGLPVAK